jgi:hypothetical protein
LLLFLIILALPAAGILFIYIFNVVLGVIALAISVYLNYHLIKFTIGQLASRIETSDTGIICKSPTNEVIEFTWDNITIAGSFKDTKTRSNIFIYNEEKDNLLKIAQDYGDFEMLLKEIKEKTPFQVIDLSDGETLEERLKQMLKHLL